jgi:hypothetical protein
MYYYEIFALVNAVVIWLCVAYLACARSKKALIRVMYITIFATLFCSFVEILDQFAWCYVRDEQDFFCYDLHFRMIFTPTHFYYYVGDSLPDFLLLGLPIALMIMVVGQLSYLCLSKFLRILSKAKDFESTDKVE